jgi:hypothetical protein
MLDVNLDRANPLTLHDQVAAQIRLIRDLPG